MIQNASQAQVSEIREAAAPCRAGNAVSGMAPRTSAGVIGAIKTPCPSLWMLQERERFRLRAEIQRVPGLLVLLMKPRNGLRWSNEDRAEMKAHLQRMGRLGLYLTVLAVPGTSLTLPLLAWWLDRRRRKRLTL